MEYPSSPEIGTKKHQNEYVSQLIEFDSVKKRLGINHDSKVIIGNHLKAIKGSLDKVISDGSKQVNLSTNESNTNPRVSAGEGFVTINKHSSLANGFNSEGVSRKAV